MLKRLTFFFIIIVFLNLAACSKDEDTGKIGKMAEIKDENPFGNLFSGKTDTFRPERAEPEKITYTYKGNEIPESFPKDLPIYSPARVTSCRILENNKGAIAVLLTQDPPGKISEFYLSHGEKEKWEIKDRMMLKSIFSLLAKKGASTINISATEGEKGTTLTIAIAHGA